MKQEPDFEILAQMIANVVCFRYKPENVNDEETLNFINEKLMHELNTTGKIYLSHTKLLGKFSLRLVVAQTNVDERHVNNAFELIKSYSQKINY